MDGRWRKGQSLPGLPAHLYDLFPARLVDSELGEIPEGWAVGSVADMCESITSGGTPARMNPLFWEGGSIPWFKTGELLDGPLIESEEHITQAALDGSSCKLWPAGTILFALYASPTVGRLGVLTRSGTSNQAAAGLIAKSTIGVPFLRRLLLHARVKLQTIAVGAAQQNINQAVLKEHRAVMPTERAASAYSRLVAAADDRQVALSKEANALATLRDALLPKLISGELRVKDAEKSIEVTA
jgi:type I restriction enzyme S subunit